MGAYILAPEAEMNGGIPYEIITVAYKSRKPLERLLQLLPDAVPVVIVDNSRPEEDLSDLVSLRPNTRYVDSGGNIGFGAACNLGARVASRPYLIFLNPDTAPDPSTFPLLIDEIVRDPSCSSCGPALADQGGTIQRGAGGWQPTFRRALAHATGLDRIVPCTGIWFCYGPSGPIEVEWLAGTCLAVRREVFLDLGGFNPEYFLYQEDMDLGRRLWERGYRQVLRADLRLLHARGGSSPPSHSRDLWALRGQMLVKYLTRHYSPMQARTLRAVLGAGYLMRAALYAARVQRGRAAEMWSYSRILARGGQ
jgi:N-acetylglucosaminyl-diphospho-decaprenol L-rhamnosyltransferase